jgi:hypothetical protein
MKKRKKSALLRRYGRSAVKGIHWKIYIARRIPGTTEYESDVHDMFIPKSTHADGALATYEASKKFRVSQDKILALPAPGQKRY